jgi:DNA repair exonuclease SbcCD nuclease subunit
MKIAHLTDLHADRAHMTEALASLQTFREVCRLERVDAIVSSGDLFHAGLQNSERDRFPEFLDAIAELLDVAPIFAVSGTPTHDLPGSYEPLVRLIARHEFFMLEPGDVVGLKGDGDWDLHDAAIGVIPDATMIIIGCPEP